MEGVCGGSLWREGVEGGCGGRVWREVVLKGLEGWFGEGWREVMDGAGVSLEGGGGGKAWKCTVRD